MQNITTGGFNKPTGWPPAGRIAALWLLGSALLVGSTVSEAFPTELFGYREVPQEQLSDFPQWLRVLERHIKEDVTDGNCSDPHFNRCHLAEWHQFLVEARRLPFRKQLEAVNRFANTRRYVLDLDNYGVEDYWAIPREFLGNGGDCEDYVITKLFSLRWLGYPIDTLRLVVVQDTNLRVPHAVLAVSHGPQTLILDNQVQQVLTDRDVVHYTPVFSINESRWWIHLPPT